MDKYFLLLICAIALAVQPSQASAAVVISEVYYDHLGDDEGHEFVELYNNSTAAVDLTDWQIQWAGGDFSQRTLSLSGIIESGAYFLIGGDFTLADFGIEPDMIYNFDFQNGGSATDGIRLTNGGNYNDTVLYDSPNSNSLPADTGWDNASFAPDVKTGESLIRADLNNDTDIMDDFIVSPIPSPENSSVLKNKGRKQTQVPETGTVVSLAGGFTAINLANRIFKP